MKKTSTDKQKVEMGRIRARGQTSVDKDERRKKKGGELTSMQSLLHFMATCGLREIKRKV